MKKIFLVRLADVAVLFLFIPLLFAEEEKKGQFFIEVGDWFVKASNMDYEISTVAAGESSTSITMPSTYGDSAKYRIGWTFKDNLGTIEFIFWNHDNQDTFLRTNPGSFSFYQNLSFPIFAGIYDDGMADGVFSESDFAVRSLSLLFSRELLKSDRVESRWGLGFRKISHKHSLDTTYFSLVPDFSYQFIDPEMVHLTPASDTVHEASSLEARGLEMKASLEFLLHKKVSFGGDIGFSFLMGRSRAEYLSRNHYYSSSGGGYIDPKEEGIVFSKFDTQSTSIAAARSKERDSIIQVTEADLHLKWNFWKTYDVTFGYALSLWNGSMLKQDVDSAETSPTDWDYMDFSQSSRAVRDDMVYQGLYLTFSYRY